MKEQQLLENELSRIDGRGYKAYKDIRGEYDFDDFTLIVDYVQGDPFATPSKVIVHVPDEISQFPSDTYENKSREVALRDFLTREFFRNAGKYSKGNRGTGSSGLISIDRPGQQILERTSVFINEKGVEVRFSLGLPAFGRKVAGRQAIDMFFDEIPAIVVNSLFYENLDKNRLYDHIKTNEDADYLRDALLERGLIAFVGDEAILPRKTGITQKPLEREEAVPFSSAESMKEEFELPNYGKASGMGIPKGVNLIVGGGYHGKSTLLNAIELGIYNHIPGDGRERVVSVPGSVKIRAEDGRYIEKTDISPFISNLPFGKDTKQFCSENASGSTSQAANIIEALEAGAECLLIDEDTSATNFMIRDKRMQELIAKEKEPITPFIDKAREMYNDYGVSSVLVIGGSGDYFDVADKVVGMDNYIPSDLTLKAKEIAGETQREKEGGEYFGRITQRSPFSKGVDAAMGKKVKLKSQGVKAIQFGSERIELHSVEQLVDESQTRAIAHAVYYARKYMDGERGLPDILNKVLYDIEQSGLDVINPRSGQLAGFRKIELASAINRLRTLKVRQLDQE